MLLSKSNWPALALAIATTASLSVCAATASAATAAEKATSIGQVASQSSETQMHKVKIQSLLQALNDYDVARASELLHPDYIQHNPFIPTGRDGLLTVFPVLQEHKTQVNNIRLMQDGDYVVAHNVWHNATPFGAKQVVTFDVFRIDANGLIAEHWDALMPNTPLNPSGRGLTDGPARITDIDKTAANKALTAEIFNVFVNGTPEQVGAIVTEHFLPDYRQHSPVAGDGIPAVFEAFGKYEWVYQRTHKIIGEGNFVLAISEGTAKGAPSAFYDLLRFENGKVAEHWDVIQTIPSEGLANQNGMFGFDAH